MKEKIVSATSFLAGLSGLTIFMWLSAWVACQFAAVATLGTVVVGFLVVWAIVWVASQ